MFPLQTQLLFYIVCMIFSNWGIQIFNKLPNHIHRLRSFRRVISYRIKIFTLSYSTKHPVRHFVKIVCAASLPQTIGAHTFRLVPCRRNDALYQILCAVSYAR